MSQNATGGGVGAGADTAGDAARLMEVTAAAITRLRNYAAENPEFQGKHVRVFIEGGGCSGMRYGFVFDDSAADDFCWEVDGQPIAVDPLSAQYLRGAKVDYVSDLRGEGFLVDNPNAKTSCGCGHSFGA